MMTADRSPAELFPDSSRDEPTYAAFADCRLVASGTRDEVLRATRKHLDGGGTPVLIFEDASGRQVDFDFRGTIDEVIARASTAVKQGPGRPRLGVVSREISLLPRHWEWLESQPNGISAAIRRLVDDARRNETGIERGRHVRNAISKFLWAIAGDFPHFEEVARALHAREDSRLESLMSGWPEDVRAHVFKRLEHAVALEAW
jgi:uncharacterized protein